MAKQPKDHTGRAREGERRLQETTVASVAAIIGIPEARRMADEIEERRISEDPGPIGENPFDKLERLQESSRGRQWLAANPHATWKEIVEVRL